MFFLSLDNQLLFLLLTLFPAALLLMSLTWNSASSDKRIHGFLLISPLLLALLSFLNAPVHHDTAEFLLMGGSLSLVVLMALAEFFPGYTNSANLLGLIALVSPFPFLIGAGRLSLPVFKGLTLPAMMFGGVLLLIALILAVKKKESPTIRRILGAFFITGGLLLYYARLDNVPFAVALVFVAFGFILRTVSIYETTYVPMRQKVLEYEAALNKVNANVHHEVIKRVESIEKSNKALLERAQIDSMTGLYGKTAILTNAEMILARRKQDPLSVVMLDIDSFKTINDTQGHPIGDRCLISLAAIAKASFRSNDVLGRYGGDEFTIILPSASPSIAITAAERFRANIEKDSNPKYTVSVGVATYPQDGETVKDLISAADQALYRSKTGGKNQVTHFSVKNTVRKM